MAICCVDCPNQLRLDVDVSHVCIVGVLELQIAALLKLKRLCLMVVGI